MVKSTKNKLIFGVLIIVLIIVIVGFSSCSCNRESYEDAVRLGQDALSNGNYGDAIYHLKRASKLSPNDYTILINLGMAYFEAEEYASAAKVFEKAVAIDYTEEALEALAVTKLKEELYEDALNVYTQALTEFGRKSNLIAGVAACHMRQGNMKYASDLLEEALDNNKKDSIALYNMAILKSETNEIVEAANYFVSFFEVVDVDVNKEQLELARKHFAKIAANYPETEKVAANVCYSNAVNYYKQQDLVSAFKETVKAANLDPTEPMYTALLIAISKKVNRPENIKRLSARIVNGFPEYAEKLRIK